jgi:hypothetical protein
MECGECGGSGDGLMAYVKGEEDPSRSAAIRAHLEACPACREEEHRLRATLDLASRARLDSFELPSGLRERVLAAARSESPVSAAAPESPAPVFARPPSSRPALAWGAAAAALLAAGLFFAWTALPSPENLGPPARLACVLGEATLLEPGSAPLAPGAEVPAGARFEVRGTARFDAPGGVRIAVRDGVAALGGDSARVESGEAAFEVRPGKAYSVRTPHGRAAVRGTRFVVQALGAETRVHVSEGRVSLSGSGTDLDLAAGESGAVRAGCAPERAAGAPQGPWTRILSPDALFLELAQPDPAKPELVQFRFTNVSGRELRLPRVHPDRPWFSLRIRSGTPVEEGLVNLAPFHVPAPGAPAGAERIALGPGETWVETFDVSSLLKAPGARELTGVYQSQKAAGEGGWTGTIESQKLGFRR